jgi:hypothetical protein
MRSSIDKTRKGIIRKVRRYNHHGEDGGGKLDSDVEIPGMQTHKRHPVAKVRFGPNLGRRGVIQLKLATRCLIMGLQKNLMLSFTKIEIADAIRDPSTREKEATLFPRVGGDARSSRAGGDLGSWEQGL